MQTSEEPNNLPKIDWQINTMRVSNLEFPDSKGPTLLFHPGNFWVAIGKEEEEEWEESIICQCAKFQNNHHKVIHKDSTYFYSYTTWEPYSIMKLKPFV